MRDIRKINMNIIKEFKKFYKSLKYGYFLIYVFFRKIELDLFLRFFCLMNYILF